MQPPGIYVDQHCSPVLTMVLKTWGEVPACLFFPFLLSTVTAPCNLQSHSVPWNIVVYHSMSFFFPGNNALKDDLKTQVSAADLHKASVPQKRKRDSGLRRFQLSCLLRCWTISPLSIQWCDFNSSGRLLIRFQRSQEM